MINEAYSTEENNLDEILKELKDIELDGLKEFASEFYHDELADLLSVETLKNSLDNGTPLDLLNSAELDEKVLQEYKDYLKEQEIRNKLQAEAEKDLPEAYRAFISGLIDEEKETLKKNPEAYSVLGNAVAIAYTSLFQLSISLSKILLLSYSINPEFHYLRMA